MYCRTEVRQVSCEGSNIWARSLEWKIKKWNKDIKEYNYPNKSRVLFYVKKSKSIIKISC